MNKSFKDMTLLELEAEYKYWNDKITNAPWGAALYASTAAAADNDVDGSIGCGKDVIEPWQAVPSRGSHLAAMFTGKIWMLNRATGERARVLPAEVADYAAKGFERGGPRSK